MWPLWLLSMFGAIHSHAWRGPLDSDCVLRDGRVGRCVPSSSCPTAFSSRSSIPCRYSRGYDSHICCGFDNRYPLNDRDDIASDDQPIYFPSDLTPKYNQYPEFTQPSTLYYNPIVGSNADYGSQTLPSYYEEHRYQGELSKPSFETLRPSFEFQNAATSGVVFHRPNNYRPQTAWNSPSENYYPNENTTPRPTWSVNESNKRNDGHETNKRISVKKCEEYSKPLTQTIDVLPLSIGAQSRPLEIERCELSAVKLIVGGEPSQPGEFPHMAALGFWAASLNKVVWNCGGTLISELYVLTAGHCVNTSNGNPVVVRLGEINLARNDDGAEPMDFRIQRVVIHPNYVKSLKYNDIALIRLAQPVNFNKWIRPACLPNTNNIEDKYTETPTATGWGRSEFAGKLSDILMKVHLNIVDNRKCNTFYNTDNPGSSSFSSGIVDTMICAGELKGGKDTCLGDSGGPLTISKRNNPCIYYVIGITSFGKMCGAPNSPGVYTRVYKYLSWIENHVWGE